MRQARQQADPQAVPAGPFATALKAGTAHAGLSASPPGGSGRWGWGAGSARPGGPRGHPGWCPATAPTGRAGGGSGHAWAGAAASSAGAALQGGQQQREQQRWRCMGGSSSSRSSSSSVCLECVTHARSAQLQYLELGQALEHREGAGVRGGEQALRKKGVCAWRWWWL